MLNDVQKTMTTMRTKKATTTLMAPSSTSLSASIAAADADEPTKFNSAAAVAMTREDEPLLYNIPAGVHATYRPLPWLVQLGTILVSGFLSVMTTWNRITWMHPIVALQSRRVNVLTIVKFLAKALATTLLSKVILEDLLLPPSRLSMNTLRQNYYLPSQLSRYETVAVCGNKNMGVHYLQYQNKDLSSSNTFALFDALFVNHGFGASSLSWLPALPSLTRRCKARIGLGHDTPGFGFTERLDNIESYQSPSSAAIGTQLLLAQDKSSSTSPGTGSTNPSSKTVALLGHSMGCITTLHMALQLPKETAKFIVLCAPALGLGRAGKSSGLSGEKSAPKEPSILKRAIQPLSSFGNRFLLTPIFGYLLRRLVGRENFWKKGLQLAWGDPTKVSESDALRFQWPSIGAGWERGLVKFAQAQARPTHLTDSELLQEVLELENTTVAVIYGSSDRVVSPKMINKFFQSFPQVPLVELDGLGHDPFEEDTESFVRVVEELLEKWNMER